jgi:hypothetical protein
LHERAGVLEDDGTVARTIPEDRIAELEAGVELYRDKADRAEQWLHKVYTEIDERFIKTGTREIPCRLWFAPGVAPNRVDDPPCDLSLRRDL